MQVTMKLLRLSMFMFDKVSMRIYERRLKLKETLKRKLTEEYTKYHNSLNNVRRRSKFMATGISQTFSMVNTRTPTPVTTPEHSPVDESTEQKLTFKEV